MADSSIDIHARIDDLKYMQASIVNVSNYVSVKLSSQQNYEIWKAQIVCLLESQQMLGIVDDQYDKPETRNPKIIIQYDKLLKGWIFGSLSEEVLKNVASFESAREVWKKLESLYAARRQYQIRSTRVSYEFLLPVPAMAVNNDKITDTKKLYMATLQGSWREAHDILKTQKDLATQVITINGDTILHVAVAMCKNNFVEKLLNFIKDEEDIGKKNLQGQTALHVAAKTGNLHAAKLLLQKRKILLLILDYKAHTPLWIAYKNLNLEIYVYLLELNYSRYGRIPDLHLLPETYQENATKHLILAFSTKQYDSGIKLLRKYPFLANNNDSIWKALVTTFPADLSFGEALIYPSFLHNSVIIERSYKVFHSYDVLSKWAKNITRFITRTFKSRKRYSWLPMLFMILLGPIAIFYPIYECICLLILVLIQPLSLLYFLLWKVLATFDPQIKEINKKKMEYVAAKKTMSLICDRMGLWSPVYSETILDAIRRDAYVIVEEILSRSLEALGCIDKDGYNVIELAIINRSAKVYNLLKQFSKGIEFSKTMTNSSKYNMAHLAGKLAPSLVLSRTRGAALQLQRELQWREEVNKLVSPTELIEENICNETPEMVFTREHEELVKQGEKWMKTTAQSSSITAALIVTIVFAAAINVPGRSSQGTGIPVFNKEIAFTIFAVFDAISLLTATAALLAFLSILTTRFSEKDFLVSLPRQLIFGLLTLIVSTASMIVAFGAILVLVFGDQRTWVISLIVGGACVPIGVIVSLQFPLVIDLWISTYVPIFE